MTKPILLVGFVFLAFGLSLAEECSWIDREVDISYYFDVPQGTCVQCPDNCGSCTPLDEDGEELKCTWCQEGHYMDFDFNCLECADGCGLCSGPEIEDCSSPMSGKYYDRESSSFKDCPIENCGYCSKDGSKCYGCDQGFVNIYNENWEVESCEVCDIENCYYCYSSNYYSWEYGYIEEDTATSTEAVEEEKEETEAEISCSYCVPPYYWDYSTKECVVCDIEHCEYCYSSQVNDGEYERKCSYCEQGYYVDKAGDCIEGDVDHCQYYYGIYGDCSYCESGFGLNDEGECVDCSTIVENCNYCYTYYTYEYDEDVETEEATADSTSGSSGTADSASSEISSSEGARDLQCSSCESGFYLDYNEMECVDCPEECETCYAYENYSSGEQVITCGKCKNGGTWDYETKECFVNDIEGCVWSWQADKCSECVNGYYFNETTSTCEACHESCVSCYGPNDYECSSCSVEKYIYYDPTRPRYNDGGIYYMMEDDMMVEDGEYTMEMAEDEGVASSSAKSSGGSSYSSSGYSNPNYIGDTDDKYSQYSSSRRRMSQSGLARRRLENDDTEEAEDDEKVAADEVFYGGYWFWMSSIQCLEECPMAVEDAEGSEVEVYIDESSLECWPLYESDIYIPYDFEGTVYMTKSTSEMSSMADTLSLKASSSSSGSAVDSSPTVSYYEEDAEVQESEVTGDYVSGETNDDSGSSSSCNGNGEMVEYHSTLGESRSVCQCASGYTGLYCQYTESLADAITSEVDVLIENMEGIEISSQAEALDVLETIKTVSGLGAGVDSADVKAMMNKMKELVSFLESADIPSFLNALDSSLNKLYSLRLEEKSTQIEEDTGEVEDGEDSDDEDSDEAEDEAEDEDSEDEAEDEAEDEDSEDEAEDEDSEDSEDEDSEDSEDEDERALEEEEENEIKVSIELIEEIVKRYDFSQVESGVQELQSSDSSVSIYISKFEQTGSETLIQFPSLDGSSTSYNTFNVTSSILEDQESVDGLFLVIGAIPQYLAEENLEDELSLSLVALVKVVNDEGEDVALSSSADSDALKAQLTIDDSLEEADFEFAECGIINQLEMKVETSSCSTTRDYPKVICSCSQIGAINAFVSSESISSITGVYNLGFFVKAAFGIWLSLVLGALAI